MATVMKEQHHESLRLFREVQGVEKALIQQIVQAVEAPYLAAIRDRTSNSLQGTVHTVLEHLQSVYGRVSPQMLEDRDQELRNMTYIMQHPIDIVFNAVEDYVDFAELGSQPLTTRQTIAKAYIILNKTRRFKNDITDWNRRTDADKTWINFKTHFRRAHQEFRETTDVTLEESNLQQNNANLVQQVVDGLQGAIPTESTTDAFSEVRLQMANSATCTT
jgi:light-regulated signal transduction histidine kinase (bacteriophytochrome)